MRAKIQKIIAALMALTVLMSFAACGGKEEATTTTAKSDEAAQTEVITNEDGENVTVEVEDESTEEDTTEEDKTEEDKTEEDKTEEDDKKTTKKEDKKTTKKDSGSKKPEGKTAIVKYYKDAVGKVLSSKAGFTKKRSSTTSKFDVPGALKLFEGDIKKFMGIGSENAYESVIQKGKLAEEYKHTESDYFKHSDYTFKILDNVKLTDADVNSATCEEKNGNYIVTINVKDGNSSAGDGIATKNNSPLDKTGICTGYEDMKQYDHKTAEIMKHAIGGISVAKDLDLKESTKNVKVVATINASSGKISNLKITFDIDCDIKVNVLGSKTINAIGTTTIEYKDFKW